MANEIQSTDLLGAELLCGYKYFSSYKELESQMNSISDDISKMEYNQITVAKAMVNNNHFTIKDFPRYEESYKLFERTKLNSAKAELAYAQKKYDSAVSEIKGRRIWFIVAIVIFVLTLAIGIPVIINYGNSGSDDPGILPLFPFLLIAEVWLIIAKFPQSGAVKKINNAKQELQQAERAINSIKITFRAFVEEQSTISQQLIYQYIAEVSSNQQLARIREVIELSNKELEFVQEKITQLKLEGKQIVNDLTEIPAYYFKEDSVIQMLFFYVNKRANNVTDLINMYEQKVFQDKLIHAVQSIKVSIDNLANVVRSSFVTLGLQLGVINESIQENTRQLLLNKDKLAQIQDDLSRNYIQTVEHINNVENIVNNQNEYITNVTNEQHNSVVANITIKPN